MNRRYSKPGKKGFYFFLISMLCVSSALYASDNYSLPHDMGKRIDEVFLAYDTAWTPGVAVAVVKDGQIAYTNAYGYAHLEYDIPNTPSTVFHIASISKQFTTFSILLLEADGKLSLDDDVRLHIPELPDFGVTITLRQMAHNISGMRDQWNLLGMAGWRLDDVISTQQVLRLLSRQKELNFNPGDEYLYSNSGFTLLAEVVARVSGQSFAEYTKERIFEPLGMHSTLFYDDHEVIVRNRAYSYAGRDGNYRKRVLSYATVGATSLFTTVEDISLWAMNFDDPVVGNADIIDKMNTRGVLNDGTTISYALGQTVGTYRGLHMISHGGADAGYRTFLARFPDHGVSLVVFSNDAGFSSNAMAMRVADIVLENYLEEDEQAEEAWDKLVVRADPAYFTFFEGHFRQAADNHLIIESDNDTLYYYTSSVRRRNVLHPLSNTEFITEGGRTRLKFPEPNNSDVSTLNLIRGDETLELPRVEVFDPSQVLLDGFTGTFYSEELDISYILGLQDDDSGNQRLVSSQLRIGNMYLTPLTPDHFSGSNWFASRIAFERNDQGHVIGFRATGSRARNVWFEKVK